MYLDFCYRVSVGFKFVLGLFFYVFVFEVFNFVEGGEGYKESRGRSIFCFGKEIS